MRTLGLDEAGRGCVLGPLVVGAFCVEGEDFEAALRAAGADDSKRIRKNRRPAIRQALRELGQGAVRRVSAVEIDGANINRLEERLFSELIVWARPDRVFIDAPVHPRAIGGFVQRLTALLTTAGAPIPALTVEPKADVTYAVVGAASVFAKVDRDAAISALGAVGSGYPSDPVTRAWIRGFIERGEALPACVRTRWGTVASLREEARVAP